MCFYVFRKWIPGCGPRLIVNKRQSEVSTMLYPDEDISKLPKYSIPCKTISNQDYYPNINIYTQFGDLAPSQFLTLFSMFRKWPEYGESSFLASYENNMLKMEASAEDSVDGIVEEDDDDVSTEERSIKDAPLEPETIQKSKRSRIKDKES